MAVCLAFGAASLAAAAQDPLVPAAGTTTPSSTDAGFYGGVVLRQGTQEGSGVQLGGKYASAWGKFVAPTADETASSARTLFFGGYRWANDIAVEAAFATADRYALAPYGRGGVGLALASPSNVAARTWNADVYTSWSFRSSLALYGRLGYVSDATLASGPASFQVGDPRRARDGVNYGVGMRYDVTRALGLRLEYARFGRFAGEGVNGPLPETDQVQFGMQYRF